MSHTMTVKTHFTDEATIAAVCKEMGIAAPLPHGKHRLYGSNQAEGIAVMLPGWYRPIVINCKDGTLAQDDMDGKHGAQLESLNLFKQLYAVHRATQAAQRQGQTVQRFIGANGHIQLRIAVR